MIKKIAAATVLSGAFALSGCATFQGYEAPDYDLKSMKLPATDQKMGYSIKTVGGGKLPINREALVSVFDDYGFDLRQSRIEQEDIPHLYVTVAKDYNPFAIVPSVITGATLYIIPSWLTVDLKVNAQVKYRDRVYRYKQKGSATLVQWLPMIFVMPAAPPGSAQPAVVKHMYQTIGHRFYEDVKQQRESVSGVKPD